MTEINVTPFVDVMLVLLIIFMVTTPLMQSGVNVDLPKQDAGFLEISEQNVVTLRRDGSIFFNEKRVSLKDLEIGLRSIAALAPTTEVYLKADRSIKYGSVVGVMGAIKRAGISRLGMVTEVSHTPEKKKRAK